MDDDNYISPYGFSPITDAVIDSILDKNDESLAPYFENLTEEQREEIEWAIDSWWRDTMTYARDQMRDLLYDRLPAGTFDD